MKRSVVALGALGVLGLALAAAPADARMRAGMLTCDVAPGVSFLVGSQKEVACEFKPVHGKRERYSGRIKRIGVDIGFTSGGKLAWAVYGAVPEGRGALAGEYAGASAEGTVGVGVGANVLVGGIGRSITLQPISVGAQQGLDVAVAVSGLQLEFVR